MHGHLGYNSTGPSSENRYGGTTGAGASNSLSANIAKINSPEIPALEQLANRLQNIAQRLHDTNRYTAAFLERFNGPKPAKDMMPHGETGGEMRPAIDILRSFADSLEAAVHEADVLSHELARIA